MKKTDEKSALKAKTPAESEEELIPIVEAEPASKTLESGLAPDLIGFSLREVLGQLKGLPYHVESEGVGFVIKQTPKPGSAINAGDKIELTLSPNR